MSGKKFDVQIVGMSVQGVKWDNRQHDEYPNENSGKRIL
jgi:hypothetical protein